MRFFYFYTMNNIQKLYELFIQNPTVSTDSRNIPPNCIFFALKGDNFNGNLFAEDALKKGAAFAVIDEKEFEIEKKTILVENVLSTLQQLARYHRDKLNIPILAITGTNGKTTTKELTSAVLAQKFKVCFTQGNLNNHIGVPLTLLAMNSETELGVVEMGANHPGEIHELCEIANPNYGLITNVGKAHLEGFGSFEGVKQTKSELFRFLQHKNGLIFLNKNNKHLCQLSENNKNKITYGTENADFVGKLIDSPPFVHLKVSFPKGVLYINSKLIGTYNFENILAAACIGNYFSIDPLKIQDAINNYQPQNQRSQFIKKGELHVVLDAYNANPTSMSASIKSFTANFKTNAFLFLGDMLELGAHAFSEHKKILDQLSVFDKNQVFLIGPVFSEVGKNYGFKSFSNTAEFQRYLEKNKIKKGNILIKGSRGIKLETVLDFL